MNKKNLQHSLLYSGSILIPCILDRLTKWMALHFVTATINMAPGISLVLAKNRGLSWGMLYAQNSWQSSLLILLVIFVISIFAYYTYVCWQQSESLVGQLLILSGAISNLLDRFIYGAVIDFIELSAYGWTWPAFNIADIAIVLGVIIMLFQQWRDQ